jgi:hypothetical protein
MTSEDLAKVVYLLLTGMPGQKPVESVTELVAVWTAVLGDLPAPAVEGAAMWHLAESKWFPTPAELRERAVQLLDGTMFRADSYPTATGLVRRVRMSVASEMAQFAILDGQGVTNGGGSV